MINAFSDLSTEEKDLMLRVPMLVSILIAGADNNIDRSEIKKSISIINNKQSTARQDLMEYYQEIGTDFEDKLKIVMQSYPVDSSERNPIIIGELEKLNDILPKLERNYAIKFYESIKDVAKKIAEASGGVLGYMAVGYEESKLIGLNMINDPSTY
ncbi:MAG: hypothetical protein AAFX87_21590 [Bacteroidota bacterium]